MTVLEFFILHSIQSRDDDIKTVKKKLLGEVNIFIFSILGLNMPLSRLLIDYCNYKTIIVTINFILIPVSCIRFVFVYEYMTHNIIIN